MLIASNFEVIWPQSGCGRPREAGMVCPGSGCVQSKSVCGLAENCTAKIEATAQLLISLVPRPCLLDEGNGSGTLRPKSWAC